jgi:hypothetical protein
MSGHIGKVHGIHLLDYCFLTFRAWGMEIEVQIAHQNGMRTCRARMPGLINIHQHFQVRGGNIARNNEKLDDAHHKMQRNNVGTPNFCLLHLVRNIAPPKRVQSLLAGPMLQSRQGLNSQNDEYNTPQLIDRKCDVLPLIIDA